MMRSFFFLAFVSAIFLAVFGGCSDTGSNPAKPAGQPHITSMQPDSAFAGDTLKIVGTDFGASKGSSTVSVGGANADTIYLWSSTEIRLKIPAFAVTGNVTVTVGGAASNAATFKVRGTVAATPPHIASVQPDSAFAGDTLKIVGTDFGASKGSSSVTVGGKNADTIYLWSATEIRLKIPATAVTGNVIVTVGGTASNAVTFKVRGTVVADVSFAGDVLPVFVSAGCTGCHGGTNNLRVDTYARLMSGTSDHGPVVTAGNGEGSVIIKKLRGTASFGGRMPASGPPFLDNATIDKISLWITQGAKNN
jgi:hypothetical protein